MKHNEFFRKNPVFTAEEFSNYLSASEGIGPRAQEALLAYYKKNGRIMGAGRGVRRHSSGSRTGFLSGRPFSCCGEADQGLRLIISHRTRIPWAGLLGPGKFHLFDIPRLNPLKFRSYIFRAVKFPEALSRIGKEDFGVLNTEQAGVRIRVTSLERTLVDVLDRPSLSGTWEEIWRSLESVEFFDLDTVVEYALLTWKCDHCGKGRVFP